MSNTSSSFQRLCAVIYRQCDKVQRTCGHRSMHWVVNLSAPSCRHFVIGDNDKLPCETPSSSSPLLFVSFIPYLFLLPTSSISTTDNQQAAHFYHSSNDPSVQFSRAPNVLQSSPHWSDPVPCTHLASTTHTSHSSIYSIYSPISTL